MTEFIDEWRKSISEVWDECLIKFSNPSRCTPITKCFHVDNASQLQEIPDCTFLPIFSIEVARTFSYGFLFPEISMGYTSLIWTARTFLLLPKPCLGLTELFFLLSGLFLFPEPFEMLLEFFWVVSQTLSAVQTFWTVLKPSSDVSRTTRAISSCPDCLFLAAWI